MYSPYTECTAVCFLLFFLSVFAIHSSTCLTNVDRIFVDNIDNAMTRSSRLASSGGGVSRLRRSRMCDPCSELFYLSNVRKLYS
jgi:hypothetical protein